jgi:hypothetical protein
MLSWKLFIVYSRVRHSCPWWAWSLARKCSLVSVIDRLTRIWSLMILLELRSACFAVIGELYLKGAVRGVIMLPWQSSIRVRKQLLVPSNYSLWRSDVYWCLANWLNSLIWRYDDQWKWFQACIEPAKGHTVLSDSDEQRILYPRLSCYLVE